MKDNFGVVFELDALLMAKAIIFIKHILIIFSTKGGGLPLLFERNTVFHIIFCFILLCFLCDLFRAGIKSSEFINSLYPWDLLDDTLTFYNIPKLILVCLTLAVFKEKI